MKNPLPDRAPGASLDLLAGVRILDLTTSIAGPSAAQLLADMGASVLKVERLAGDDSRSWGPPFLDGESLWFLSVNRNKQSIALDFGKPDGLAVLKSLLQKSDVVIINLVHSAQRKLGIDHAALMKEMPGLVHVSLTGFGLEGERADKPCYDLIAEGYSGVMDLTGESASPPQKIGTPAADLLAGNDAATAVLAALLRKGRTGQGCAIDISMVDSMVRFLAPNLMSYLGSGNVPRRSGGKESVIAIYQVFETADLPMTLALGNDAIWSRFWAAIGDAAFGARSEFGSNALRRAHRPEIVSRISAVLAEKPRADWLAMFSHERVPAGPINQVDEVCNDLELQRRGLLYSVQRQGTAVPQVGLGIRFDGQSAGCRSLAPRLGEHTEEVLKSWLDMVPADIEMLRANSILLEAKPV